MQRTLVLALLLSFTLVAAIQAQLPANLDCKCTATGDGEYLCKCVPSNASPETLPNNKVRSTGTSTTATSTPFVLPEPPPTKGTGASIATSTAATPSTAAKGTETPTGTSTSKGQPIYTGPRGGQYHYSDSGKKVYTRKK